MAAFLYTLGRLISAPFRRSSSGPQKPPRRNPDDEIEDTPLPDVIANAVENPSEIFEHLDVLRKHLFRALIGMAIATGLSFFVTNFLIEKLSEPIGGLSKLQAIDVTETIGVYMRVALLAGFAIALPYIIFELWRFVEPALKRKEKIFGLIAIPSATILFLAGAGFSYFVMLPTALPFLTTRIIPGITTTPRLSSYVGFVSSLLFWVGIAFEFPLVIYVLAAIHLVTGQMLLKQWRIAVVAIAILAAAITPTVDPINMSLVMGPMIMLYFLSIGLAFIAQGGRNKAAET